MYINEQVRIREPTLMLTCLRFDQTLSRLRAVRLRDAIEGQGLSVEAELICSACFRATLVAAAAS